MKDMGLAALVRLVTFSARRAWLVILLAMTLTAAIGWYTVNNFAISTDTTDMLSSELEFRRNSDRLSAEFPQMSNNLVIVLDGATADQVDDAALKLARALAERPQLYSYVYDPRGGEFFRRNGLLFLDEDELSSLVDRLAESQAFLGKLWRDPSLRGLFGLLQLALENREGAAPPASLDRVLGAITAVVENENSNAPGILSWQELMGGEGDAKPPHRRVLIVQPVLDHGSLQPAGDAIDDVRDVARDLGITPRNGVRVRLTGSAALEEEELESVAEGMGIAAALSVTMVLVLLFWGLRSVRLVGAMILTLMIGLIWTAGFAIFAVGRLNLISVAFAVLFIGLSVDFGIHFVLRFREELDLNRNPEAAFRTTPKGVGGALTLCAVAAAIAFYSFMPTDYVGLAELGIIAGTGMFIALFANLTVLPAFIALSPPAPAPVAVVHRRITVSGPGWIENHARSVVVGAAVVALGAMVLLPSARFDFDPLSLKDRNTESVQALFDLMEGSETGPYSIEFLSPDRDTARKSATALEKLSTVDFVLSVERFVPEGQDEKLQIIDTAAFLLLPAFEASRLPAPDDDERRRAYFSFRDFLRVLMMSNPTVAIQKLESALSGLPADTARIASLERRLLTGLEGRLNALRASLEAAPVAFADVPVALRARFISPSGKVRLEVFPKEDLRDRFALERFVAEVRTIVPAASGSPVIIIEAGRAVIGAFVEAAGISIVTIGIIIWVLLRRLRDVALVFAPLLLAALLTAAATVLLSLPFNFANIIVLPLLFGLGVASAIHLVLRARRTAGVGELFATSTPRAVVFSALTTIGSFASIALSSHPGTSSMGVLLAIAISLTLGCTLVVLPALLALGGRKKT
jgi:hypothetical protein